MNFQLAYVMYFVILYALKPIIISPYSSPLDVLSLYFLIFELFGYFDNEYNTFHSPNFPSTWVKSGI
jgi:surface polysaccharide O-acyltransferase-like enzyme